MARSDTRPPNPASFMHDPAYNDRVTAAATEVARLMLERGTWRTNWRVEIDGCVFKFKIDGYAKHGTPRAKQIEAEQAEARRQFEEEHGGD